MNTEVMNDEPLSIYSFFNHISENIYGFLLIILAFVIIYIVDHIARYNSILFAMPSPIPGIPSSTISPVNKIVKIKKKVKK
jgi:hypothetical protein